MKGAPDFMSFVVGCFLAFMFSIAFLRECTSMQFMPDIIHGIKYEGKIYHAVVDSVRTDSLHNWRKQ